MSEEGSIYALAETVAVPETVPTPESKVCPLVVSAGTEILNEAWQMAPGARYWDGGGGQSLVMVSGLVLAGGPVGENGARMGVWPRLVAVTVRVWGEVEGVTMPKSNSLGDKGMGKAGLVIAGRLMVWLVTFDA